jgi:LysM repeat protein
MWSALALWATPVALSAAANATHIVKKGDTLDALARHYGTSVNALKSANQLRSDVIKVGQRLKVPNSGATSSTVIHIVSKGETLGLIARNYDTRVSTIKSANNLRSDLIRVGQKLKVPVGHDRSFSSGTSLLAPVIAATNKIRVDSTRWSYIVCHHSAIEAGNAKVYGAAHERRGMENGLAYHFVIGNGQDSGDGEIEIGPRWVQQLRGGHVRSSRVNDSGIGICLVGNFENHRPTTRQSQAMNQLLEFLKDGYSRAGSQVTVHKWVDKNHTVCPGKYFPYNDLKRFA